MSRLARDKQRETTASVFFWSRAGGVGAAATGDGGYDGEEVVAVDSLDPPDGAAGDGATAKGGTTNWPWQAGQVICRPI
jgi:hypothetical protein